MLSILLITVALLDLTGRLEWIIYTHHEVGKIIEDTYPSLMINIFKADSLYGTLDFNLLNTIWDSSKLGDYDYKQQKFNCDDFAVCMKDAVSKYSHDQSKPGEVFVELCMEKNAKGHHVYNYTVNPFRELILFEL